MATIADSPIVLPLSSGVLKEFFSSIVANPADSNEFYRELEIRLPRRGCPLYRNAWSRTLRGRMEDKIEDHKFVCVTSMEQNLITSRLSQKNVREWQCSDLIAKRTLRFLYKPAGPMCRRSCRELEPLLASESSDLCDHNRLQAPEC